MLIGLNHITLSVGDLARSVTFYQGTLGLRLAARWDAGAYLTLGELWLCLSLDTDRRDAVRAGYTHYALSMAAADFCAFVQRLRDQGVREWKSNHSEGESFYFLDPDGHQLEIHVGDLASRLARCRTHPYGGMVFFD